MPKGNRMKNNGTKAVFYRTVETIYDAKVIVPTEKGSYSLPRMSHSPNALYIIKSKSGDYTSLGIYNKYREIVKEIDVEHVHKSRKKDGTILSVMKRGVAHVHNNFGGRENNVRYMTKKEKKLYGKYISFMGGRMEE